jgi:hypothetical protein
MNTAAVCTLISKPTKATRGMLGLMAFAVVLRGGICALAAVSEDVLPQADWISATLTADSGQTAFFRKTFTAQPALVKAVLLGACDERMTVFLNGEVAAEIGGFERAASMDVTRYVREGQNVLAVRAEHADGLAAFRLMLEMATERGRQSWVASDATWQCVITETEDWNQLNSKENWRPAIGHGQAGLQRWGDAFNARKSVDAYNSWMLASGAAQATDPKTLDVLPGYRVELLRSAQPEEGSWIGLAFDPKGRITIAREQRGLLRMTLGSESVDKVEVIEDTLLECRGLLYAYDALYVNANNSKGLYRLRDSDGDEQFDEKKLLLAVGGGVGHGRNHLRLGPDGLIYIAQGNDVDLPANVARDSPLRHTATDQLFPLNWGEHGTTKGIVPPHGHILQTDRDGSFWRVFAGGLRNELDVDFNEDGEMFTYDADNERDIAAPWYRPRGCCISPLGRNSAGGLARANCRLICPTHFRARWTWESARRVAWSLGRGAGFHRGTGERYLLRTGLMGASSPSISSLRGPAIAAELSPSSPAVR